MSYTLANRVALVTGGSKGIGKAIMKALALEGASVAITARDEAVLKEVTESYIEFDIYAIPTDALNQQKVELAIEKIITKYGKLDILVNNIGGVSKFAGFPELEDQDWIDTFNLNVLSMVHFTKAAEKYLIKSECARIINISSISGIQPGEFNPHYALTKAATINLSKSMANYYVKNNILVNTVCPGPVHSDSWNKNIERIAHIQGKDVELMRQIVDEEESSKIPLGRVGEGDDIAGLVTFLASDKASWITGSTFHINGGKLRSI